MPARSPPCSTPRALPSTVLRNVIGSGGRSMYLNEDGTLGFGNPDAITSASHGETSVARIAGRETRGPLRPRQPVNEFLHAMREDWDELDAAGRVEYIRGQLELIEHPLDMLDDFDHVTN